ncbi:hypothetical protein NHP190002_12310 [Helicobacter ailurogastricus]|nr:hypothetical protein NHP190002_12310 [Helicobacter ailurogastricus]
MASLLDWGKNMEKHFRNGRSLQVVSSTQVITDLKTHYKVFKEAWEVYAPANSKRDRLREDLLSYEILTCMWQYIDLSLNNAFDKKLTLF